MLFHQETSPAQKIALIDFVPGRVYQNIRNTYQAAFDRTAIIEDEHSFMLPGVFAFDIKDEHNLKRKLQEWHIATPHQLSIKV